MNSLSVFALIQLRRYVDCFECQVYLLDFAKFPKLAQMLDISSTQVYALDCTYSARLPNERTAQQVIDALRGTSNGHTKSRGDNYQTTAYWGAKESRLKRLKAYLKHPEFLRQLEDAKRAGRGDLSAARTMKVLSNPLLQEHAKDLLRFEATVMHRWLERRGVSSRLVDLIAHQQQLAGGFERLTQPRHLLLLLEAGRRRGLTRAPDRLHDLRLSLGQINFGVRQPELRSHGVQFVGPGHHHVRFGDSLARHGDDPLLQVALELEKIALTDEYFIEKKLYPNIDFYSGITLKAMGFPVSMFTVLFAVARTAGWIAQWKEMIEDPSQKIGRPRQLFSGAEGREYVAQDKRK